MINPRTFVHKPESSRVLSASTRALLRERLSEFHAWKHHLDSFPDQIPVLKIATRPKGHSGVYRYQPSYLNYDRLSDQWFKGRNITYKRNFVHYLTQLFSMLVEAELLDDESLSDETEGVELYSPDLKRINRNYAEFNKVLFQKRFLDLLDVHDADEGRCRRYAISREILRKGIERRYLSKKEKKELVNSIRVDPEPDKTTSKRNPVIEYYLELLRRTQIDQKKFKELEIELGRFRKLYPMVVRHQLGKYDVKIGEKEGRLYSVYLYSPKEFRKLIRLDGKRELVEGDVAACHFHLFLDEMTDEKEREEMKRDLLSSDPYLSMCGVSDVSLRAELKKASHKFKYGNRTVNQKVLQDAGSPVGLTYREGLFFRHISKKYPVFAESMAQKKISHPKHRSDFSCQIMRKESEIMVQLVGEQCMMEKLFYLPIHDGFLTLPEQFDRVCQIVTECFQKKTHSTPLIRKK
jgi:hypothetical protein